MKFQNTILFDIGLLLSIILLGSAGYMVIENWSFIDALYMTIITITTIGFSEVHQLDVAGRIFTIFLIIFGLGTITYTLGSISSYVFRGKFYFYLQSHHMEKKIASLKNHFIICGASDTSLIVMQELAFSRKPFILIDTDEAKIKRAMERGALLYVQGDATDENTLDKAGITRAKGLVASLGNDHDDVFLIMTARGMHKNLKIYAKIKDETSRKKLILAGADVILNPYEIGGMRLASMILRPKVVEFLDDLRQEQNGLRIEEIIVDEENPLCFKTLSIGDVQDIVNARVIAIRKKDDTVYQYRFHGHKIHFDTGDCLFVLEGKE